jgi:CP family cyanate transporter-like MFS transporter
MNHESPTGYSPHYRFAAIAGLLILSIALRPAIVSIGPILLLIQQHFQLSYAQASLLTSIPDICMGVCALLAPGISRRFGTDHAVVAALVLLAVATVMRALSLSADMLLLSTVLVGIGIAVAGSLIGGWIKTHFPQHAALFMGVYAAGLSLGATAAATSTEFFTAWGNNWRIGAGIWALLCVTAIVSWVLLARRFNSPRPAATPHKAAAVRLPWKNTQAWLIAIYFGLSQFIVYAFFAWLAPAAAQMGLSTLRPGVLLGLFTGVFAIASLTTGALPGKAHDRRHWLAISTALIALGIGVLTFAPGACPTLCIIVSAFGSGMAFTLAMTLPLDNVTTAAKANAWTVLMLFVGYLIAALGPLCFGSLRDHSGSYFESFLLLFIVAAAMLGLTPLLKPAVQHDELAVNGALT